MTPLCTCFAQREVIFWVICAQHWVVVGGQCGLRRRALVQRSVLGFSTKKTERNIKHYFSPFCIPTAFYLTHTHTHTMCSAPMVKRHRRLWTTVFSPSLDIFKTVKRLRGIVSSVKVSETQRDSKRESERCRMTCKTKLKKGIHVWKHWGESQQVGDKGNGRGWPFCFW